MQVLKRQISELPSLLPTIADEAAQPLTTTEHTLNEAVIRVLAEQAKRSRDVHTTECASYTMLGILCVHFASTLAAAFQMEFEYVNQFRVTKTSKSGPPPQTDSAVALVVGGGCIPRILYECKTIVASFCNQIADGDLIEVLLQGYYCLKYYKLNRLMIYCYLGVRYSNGLCNCRIVLHYTLELRTWCRCVATTLRATHPLSHMYVCHWREQRCMV